jgi:hypothetical protein
VYWLTAPSGHSGALYRASRTSLSTVEVIAANQSSPVGLATMTYNGSECIYWLTGDGQLHPFTANFP